MAAWKHTTLVVSLILFNVAQCNEIKKKGHMEPIGSSGTITPIEQIEGFPSPQDFLKKYTLLNKPILMKGAGKISPALTLWTDEYLRSKTPDGKEGEIQVELGKKETRLDGAKDMNFKTYLDTYNDSNIYMVNKVPKYLAGDIVTPWSLQCDDYNKSFDATVMWFSSGGTKSLLHHDAYENINCLYRGEKYLIFINTTKYIDIEPKIIDVHDGTYSSMDVERVDLTKFPFLEGMEFFSVNMKPGDCLYIPIKWIHHVASTGSNLAVNIWWNTLINKRVNTSKCQKEFNPSITLDKLNFANTEEDLDASPDVESKTATAVFENAAILAFQHKKTATLKEFLAAFKKLGEIDEMTMHNLELIFKIIDTNRNGVMEMADLSKPVTNKKHMKLLFEIGQLYDSWARVNDIDFRLTVPTSDPTDEEQSTEGAQSDSAVESSDDTAQEQETIERANKNKGPTLDENIYMDLGNKLFKEL